MNRATKQIALLLKIDLATAWEVQVAMMHEGVDFSSCTKTEFNNAARYCYARFVSTI